MSADSDPDGAYTLWKIAELWRQEACRKRNARLRKRALLILAEALSTAAGVFLGGLILQLPSPVLYDRMLGAFIGGPLGAIIGFIGGIVGCYFFLVKRWQVAPNPDGEPEAPFDPTVVWYRGLIIGTGAIAIFGGAAGLTTLRTMFWPQIIILFDWRGWATAVSPADLAGPAGGLLACWICEFLVRIKALLRE